jgi:hypothetical protein
MVLALFCDICGSLQPEDATLCEGCGSKLPRPWDDALKEANPSALPSAPAQDPEAEPSAESERVLDLRSERQDARVLEHADIAMATVGALTRAAATISGIEPAVPRSPSAADHADVDIRDRTVTDEADRSALTPDEPQVRTSAKAPDELPDVHTVSDMDRIDAVARHSARWLAGTLVLVVVLASIVIGLGYVVELYMHS